MKKKIETFFSRKFLFIFLPFFFAFAGMIYEYILAYYVTGLLGGGYGILFLTFTLFATFIGIGSVSYNFVPEQFKNISHLGFLQLCLGVATAVIPFFFKFLNEIYTLSQISTQYLLILSLIPIATIGFITGFEIPYLYYISKRQISKILFWDYLGMFTGIILFPLFLASNINYQSIILTLSCIAIVIGITLMKMRSFLFHDSDQLEVDLLENEVNFSASSSTNSNRLPLLNGLLITFIFSFCSFAYQGLIGKVVISILGDNHYVQAYSIGFFIIGMVLGSYVIDNIGFLKGSASKILVTIETLICIMGCLTPVFIYFIGGSFFLLEGTLINLTELQFLIGGSIVFSIFPLSIGCLTGMELPLVFRWLNLKSSDPTSYWIIASNYIAAVVSGILIAYILPRYLGHSFSFLPIVIVNFIALSIVISYAEYISNSFKVIAIGAILAGAIINSNLINKSRQFYLNASYAKIAMLNFSFESLSNTLKAISFMGSAERIESFYQNIDLVTTEENQIEGREFNFSLFLNKHPQFNSEIFKNYHQSMSLAAASFVSHEPQSILILGGGDGLLAAELIKQFPKAKIKLIELDPAMVELASENNRFATLNEMALHNSRVQVIVADAYSFVRKGHSKFDLVFIDFPYPTSIDLSRLYSFEFYHGLHNILEENGVAIIDAPLLVNFDLRLGIETQEITKKILSTIYFSGFTNIFCFGPFDPFIAISNDNRSLQFSDSILKDATNPVFINLKSINHSIGNINYDKKLINRVLSPTILEML